MPLRNPPVKQTVDSPEVILPLKRKKSNEDALYEDPLQFAWAISYSDLLMVMLCFFIIFFEMSDLVDQTPIRKIILSLKKNIQAIDVTQQTISPATRPALTEAIPQRKEKVPAVSPDSIKKLVGSGDLVTYSRDVLKSGEEVVIDFPEGFFSPGSYELTLRAKEIIGMVLGEIRKHENLIQLTFIGHTDSTPVMNLREKNIHSNMILSTFRATDAAFYAIKLGFDKKWVFVQGMGENTRNTRSLSLKIALRSPARKPASAPASFFRKRNLRHPDIGLLAYENSARSLVEFEGSQM